MWMGLVQSVEGLERKRLSSPFPKGRNSASRLKTAAVILLQSPVSSLLACPEDFGLASPTIA